MLRECRAMASHALASGDEVPASVLQTIQALGPTPQNASPTPNEQSSADMEQLTAAHQRLVTIVAPATPRAITLLQQEAAAGGVKRFFGAVPLVRQLMAAALIFLVMLVAFATSDATSVLPGAAGNQWSIFTSSGKPMLIRLLFLMSAAGMGACFAGLFRPNRFVVNETYDPKYAMTYWIRLLLGLIAGVVLCELIPVGDDPSLQGIGKPSLALLGGFSGNTLYRILERLVQSIESVVRGDERDVAEAEARVLLAQANQKAAEHRVAFLAALIGLRLKMDGRDDLSEARMRLDTILAELGADQDPVPPSPKK
jgi:hypothetical protein